MGDNNKREKRKSRQGFGTYAANSVINPIRRGTLGLIRMVIGYVLVALLAFFLLSGVINQVKTGETLAEYAMDIGHRIQYFLESLFTEDSPLKVTEDGVYLRDADIPDESAIQGEHGDDIKNWKESLENGEEDEETDH